MSDAPASIVVADDHALIRKGLVEVIRSDPTFTVVAEAGDGAAALALVEKHRARVVVTDLQMPKMSGLELASAIRSRGIDARIVILTAHETGDLLDRALELGVSGYLLKDGALDEILACLHMVLSGRTYLTPSLSDHLVSRRGKPAQQPGDIDKLTPAEKRVLRLVAGGKTTDAIAAELGLSPKTVENHRTHMAAKLGLRGANALLKFAVEHRADLESDPAPR
jgi:DNA-binding NarL/FixJ family response regulator